MTRERLDLALVARGLARSRSAARDYIKRGYVTVNGEVVHRPADVTAPDDDLVCTPPRGSSVSRAGEKLIAALEAFPVEVAGRIALDIGASTGGFTQVLLQHGAERVFAIDVGQGQLAERLRADQRVLSLEKLDARDLTGDHLDAQPNLLVSDVSFISLTKALGPALGFLRQGSPAILLVKPQFELGPDAIGKGGLVTLEPGDVRTRLAETVLPWVTSQGFHVRDVQPCPVTGGDGNQEYLLWAEKTLGGPHG